MAKVEVRKARKDYPREGIKAGETYYYTKLKLQRGGMVKRSKTPFKPSQLTNSPFKSGFLAAGEGWEDSDKDGEEPVEPLDDLDDDLENDEAREIYDSDMEEWQSTSDDYDSEVEHLQGEADDLIGDMPE